MKPTSKIAVLALGAALTAGLVAPATSDAAPAQRKAAFKVTLKASSTKAVVGKPLIVAGKVKPAVKGTPVVLQRKLAGGKWAVEARLKTSKKGAYTYTDKPHIAGVRQYRAVVPKAGKVRPGVSRAVKVTVYAWHSLTDTPTRTATGTGTLYGTKIAGKTYSPSYGPTDGAFVGNADWNLDPTCTTLRVRFGNGDDSDEGATAHLTLTGDGETLFTGSYGLTQSAVKTFDIRKVFRLAYSWTSTAAGSDVPAPGAQPLLAQPELLCAS
ncbi:hypothetical protein GCM10009795_016950 [Nocardioides hankookensis]|uniref:Htaa domain-containing protein n=1 Tax=Nocardioides hankookensis TaxID=443157 RepID=A0ABW1LK78_9ACTN